MKESIETKPFNLHDMQKETSDALNRAHLELVHMTRVNFTGVVFWMKKERRFLEFSKKQTTCPSVIPQMGSETSPPTFYGVKRLFPLTSLFIS